jgi:hypothetical protein
MSILVLEFSGGVLIRLPTDPDPMDEKRGVSGYTFAFGDEPDLDRIVHLQPPPNYTMRSYSPAVGVSVQSAARVTGAAQIPLPALLGARVDLLDSPVLENRNWNLTLPGYEPIVPFHLHIASDAVQLDRTAPLDAQQPDLPIYEVPQPLLEAQGARGLEFEPQTVGKATGVWDALGIATERRDALQRDLAQLQRSGTGTAAQIAILQGRIAELDIGIASGGSDRRVGARAVIERFGFELTGPAQITGDQRAVLGGTLDPTAPWRIDFWMGAWDADTLTCFMQGSLTIPFTT